MAVKTTFTHDDFVTILSMYDLGVYTHSEAITQGTVQTNYIVQTTQGKCVLRYYETRTQESVFFESELLTHLTARQYPSPTQVRNTQGTFVGMYREKPYVIFEFIKGHHIEQPGAYHWPQVIQKAAELQKITTDFSSKYTSYRWNYTPDLCRRLAHEQAMRINTKNAWDKFTWLEGELRKLELPVTLPKGICHCDFHFSNILFQNDEFSGLLDFDDANNTFLQFDLVGLIEYWAWPHSTNMVDLEKARDIVQAYMKHRLLDPLEQHHLIDVYKLSILFDCVWFFGRGTAGDFYEKRKIDALTGLGRQKFVDILFKR